jgi:acetyltransferase-like isoleucine patch superfamily enzyme
MGSLVRLLSPGVRPGRHPAVSAVTLAWMILNGIFTLAYRIILPLVPMTFFAEMFYRLCGMRMGKGVRINTFLIMDPYLVEIGSGSVIGGDAVLSPHVFEGGTLVLAPIRIGAGCLVGGQAYISPGVEIGDGSTVGLRVYVRKGRRIPPHSRITSLAGMDARDVHEIERRHRGSRGPAGKPGDTMPRA